MAYRHRHYGPPRYRRTRRRRRSREENDGGIPFEELGEGLANALGSLLVGAFHLLRWLWRWALSRRSSSRPPVRAQPQMAQGAASVRLTTPPPGPVPIILHRATVARPAVVPAAAPAALPYRRSPHLLSKGERAFWYPLYRAVKGKYRLFCKVRLADVVQCPDARWDEARWFRKIGRYHVDFVICDPKTTAPLLVVELDDRSHRSARSENRDQFKAEVLAAAGMPIYRVNAQKAYDPAELGGSIQRLIDGAGR